MFCWRDHHEIGYAKPARHLGRVEHQSNHEDDVIFLHTDMCLINRSSTEGFTKKFDPRYSFLILEPCCEYEREEAAKAEKRLSKTKRALG
jgi:hypothetical protein